MANGLIELHAATGELRWLEEAHRLALLAVELFADEKNGGFFQTPAGGEQLVVRKKIYDRVVSIWWEKVRGWLLVGVAAVLSLFGIGRVMPALRSSAQ